MTIRKVTMFKGIPNDGYRYTRVRMNPVTGSAANRVFNFKLMAEGGGTISFTMTTTNTSAPMVVLDPFGSPRYGANVSITNVVTSPYWRKSTSELIYMTIESDSFVGYNVIYCATTSDSQGSTVIREANQNIIDGNGSGAATDTYTEPNIPPVMFRWDMLDLSKDEPTTIDLMKYSMYADPTMFLVGSDNLVQGAKTYSVGAGDIVINDNGTATFTPKPDSTNTYELDAHFSNVYFSAGNQYGRSSHIGPTSTNVPRWRVGFFGKNDIVKRTKLHTFTDAYTVGNTSIILRLIQNNVYSHYTSILPTLNVKIYTTQSPEKYVEVNYTPRQTIFNTNHYIDYNNETGDVTFRISGTHYGITEVDKTVVSTMPGVRSSSADTVVFEITSRGHMIPFDYVYFQQDGGSTPGFVPASFDTTVSQVTPPSLVDKTMTVKYQTSSVVNVIEGGTSGSSDFDLNSLMFNFDGTWTKYLETTGGQKIKANTDGTITVYSGAGYSGAIPQFQARINNTEGVSDISNIDITVSSEVNTVSIPTDENGEEFEEGKDVTVNPIDYTDSFSPLNPETVKVKDPSTGLYGPGYTTTDGSLTVDPVNGNIIWSPAPEYQGPVPPIDYIIDDTDNNPYNGIINVPTVPEKTPPVLTDKVYGDVIYDAPTTFDIMLGQNSGGNYPFDFTTLQIKPVSDVTYGNTATVPHGVFSITDDYKLLWTPNGTMFEAVDPINFRISNTAGKSDEGQVNVTMIKEKTPPVLTDKVFSVGFNRPTTLDVLTGQDSGNYPFDASTVEVGVVGSGVWSKSLTIQSGAFEVVSDGTIVFTPVTDTEGVIEDVEFKVSNTVQMSDTALISVTVNPKPTPPVLTDKVFTDTPYETSIKLDVLDGQNSGNYPFDVSSAMVKTETGTEPFSKTITFTEGTIVVEADGNITWSPTRTFEGPAPRFIYTISNTEGLSDEAFINISVQTEPPVPVKPLGPLTGAKWLLGDFQSGLIEYGYEIPYVSDKIGLDLHGDDIADIVIPLYALSDTDRLNWKTKFEINQKMLACVDSVGNVVTAGYIEKRDIDLKAETLTLKMGSMKKWLNTLFAVNGERNQIVKSDETWTLIASPRTVGKNVVSARLNNKNMPSSIRYPASRPGSYKKVIVLSELVSIADVLTEISTDPNGVELKLVPIKVNDYIVWDLRGGSPYLNDDGTTITVNLNDPKTIAHDFSQMDDGSTEYNKVWLESKFEGQTDTNINLKSMNVPSNTKLIREIKEKFDVVLTETELQSQFQARLEDGNKVSKDNTISVFDDDHSYYGQVGRRLKIVGGEKSAGLDDTVRIVGVSFSTKQPFTSLTVTNIKKVYPPLPKDIASDIIDKSKKITDDKMKWDSGLNGNDGFESTPTDSYNPGEDWGGNNYSTSDLWGDEGQVGNEQPTWASDTAVFENYNAHTLSPVFNDGGLPYIDPRTIDKNFGNTITALDHNYDSYSWTIDGEHKDVPFHTLIPQTDLRPFFLRSCNLINGSLTGWVSRSNFTDYIIMKSIQHLNFKTNNPTMNYPQSNASYTISNTQVQTKINLEVGCSVVHIYDKLYLNFALIMSSRIVYTYDETNVSTGVTTNKSGSEYYSIHRGGVVMYSVDDDIWLDGETAPPNNIFIYPTGTSKYASKLIIHQGLDIPGYKQETGQKWLLKDIRPRQVNIIRSGQDSKFYPFPTTSLDGTSPRILETFAFNGWYYAVDGYNERNGGMYRIRLTDNGIIPPDAVWVPTTEKSYTNLSYRPPTGIIGLNGVLVFFHNDTLVSRKIDRSNGTLGVEIGIASPYNGFFQSRGTDNRSSNYDKSEYFNELVMGSTSKRYSKPLSYGGFIYMIMSTLTNIGDLSITSMRLEDGQGGTGSTTDPGTGTDTGTGGDTTNAQTIDQSQEYDAVNKGDGLDFWTTNTNVGTIAFHGPSGSGLDWSMGITPNQIANHPGTYDFDITVEFFTGEAVDDTKLVHTMTIPAPTTSGGGSTGGTTTTDSIDQTVQYDAVNKGSSLDFWTTDTSVGTVSFFGPTGSGLDWSMGITPNQIANHQGTYDFDITVRFHQGDSAANTVVHSLTIPAPGGTVTYETVDPTVGEFGATQTSPNEITTWSNNPQVDIIGIDVPDDNVSFIGTDGGPYNADYPVRGVGKVFEIQDGANPGTTYKVFFRNSQDTSPGFIHEIVVTLK